VQILISGGAGFIGGHLAEEFVSRGHDVVVLDNFEPYYDLGIKEHNVEVARETARQRDGTYELVEGDVRDSDLVDELVANADAVFHQAAQAGVRTSVSNPMKPSDINIVGTLNILESARDTDLERIVMASSSSVYGVAESLPYSENHPKTPVSPYGISKLAGEQYGRVLADLYDLPIVSLRYFTVYGPRMRPNMAISNFVSRCFDGEPPVLYGNGSQTRDFTYIDDVVRVNQKLLNTDAADGEILNVGSSDNISIAELATEIRDQLSPGLEIEYGERSAADAEHTHADISKASRLLDYEPTYSIRGGVAEFIDWYEANREWYGPLVRNS